jgi:ubiquinone/menaquinone biosynthesis C-methylase UbiE
MSTEQHVARHYTRGTIERTILDALTASGKDIENLSVSDLSAVDEFHLGWHAATVDLARDLGLEPGMHVLDIGSGIGGPARHFAKEHGCRVTGIDLTDEFVRVAQALTRRCGLADRVSFRTGTAMALPFAQESFDAVSLIHVGMNIGDKGRLFDEVRRVLRPEARFAIFDIMRVGEGELPFPMPWAAAAATSFVERPEEYRSKLQVRGFEIESERNRLDLVLAHGHEMVESLTRQGMPMLGLHLLMGPAAPERLANIMSAVERGLLAPVEIVARMA